jgi:hypothetical protein
MTKTLDTKRNDYFLASFRLSGKLLNYEKRKGKYKSFVSVI